MAFLSPLRYPGGKNDLANYIKLVYQENNLLDAPYVEIYAGGAGIALSLLFSEYTTHIYINDLDRSIYAFWHSVLNETNALCERIRNTPVNMTEWYRQKEIQELSEKPPLLDLGFSTFFLNRTNRSGIIQGGVIGGKEQKGNYKIDARFNKDELIERIRRIARFKSRISIFNLDAAHFIQNQLPELPQRSLVYLDPPYYEKGQDLYQNYYEHQDHINISRLLASVSQHWIVSYDSKPEIISMYQGYRKIIYNLSYSVQDRYQGSEVMFFSRTLTIPSVKSPANLDAKSVNRSLFPQ